MVKFSGNAWEDNKKCLVAWLACEKAEAKQSDRGAALHDSDSFRGGCKEEYLLIS